MYDAFCDLFGEIAEDYSSDPVEFEVLSVIRADFIDLNDVQNGNKKPPQILRISNTTKQLLKLPDIEYVEENNFSDLILDKKHSDIVTLQRSLGLEDSQKSAPFYHIIFPRLRGLSV